MKLVYNNLVEIIKKNKLNIVLIFCWFCVALTGLLHHEIWRDEAQVWCLVRDCSFFSLFDTIKIEGHPILWYLILLPFAKLHFTVEAMQIIGFLFVFASVIFFLFNSPFNNFQRIIITFSAGMVYYLPVVVRNYALVPLFLFVLAYLYPKRSEKPILYAFTLILLANTHLLMFGFCCIVSALFVLEQVNKFIETRDNKLIIAPILTILNILFLLFSFMNSAGENTVIINYSIGDSIITQRIRELPLIFYNKISLFDNLVFEVIFYFIIFSLAFFLFKYSKKLFCIMSVSFLWILYCYVFVWFGGYQYQKIFLFLLVLLFCFWNYNDNKYKIFTNKILNFLFIISVFIAYTVIFTDVKYNFSCSKQTVEFIKNNLKNEKVFLYLGDKYEVSPLSAYLPDIKIYSVNEEKYITYASFSRNKKRDITDTPINAKYLIVQSSKMHDENDKDKALIFSSKEKIYKNKEFYSIYDLNP